VDAEFFGKLKVGDNKSFVLLHQRLQVVNVLDWEFDFWDTKEGYQIRKKFEALMDINKDIHVHQAHCENLRPAKRHKLNNVMHVDEQLVFKSKIVEISVEPMALLRVSSECNNTDKDEVF